MINIVLCQDTYDLINVKHSKTLQFGSGLHNLDFFAQGHRVTGKLEHVSHSAVMLCEVIHMSVMVD